MSYPPNPPEGAYPPPGQYPNIPQQPGQYQPPGAAQEEPPPTPPFATGQPTTVVNPAGGYPQQASPAPQPPPAYQPGAAAVPPYPPPPAFGDSYSQGLPPTAAHPMVSGPPSSDPLSGPPGYGPVSGPSYGAPMSGLPGYGEAKPRRGATILFAALTVLFFLATAVLTGLYVTKSGDFDKQSVTLKSRDNTISSQTTQIDDLKKQLQSARDQLDQANQKQTGTQNQLDQVTKEKQVIGNCLTLLSEAIIAANKGDSATAQSKAAAAQQPCDEADKYLK